MQKYILVLVLMFVAMSSAVWAGCGKFCNYKWWETATASDVQAELDAGTDVNTRSIFNGTPLHRAVIDGTAEMVQLLIAAGADVNTRNKYTETPLHSAVTDGTAEMVQLLIAAGVDVNTRTDLGFTPLHLAAEYGTAEKIQLLIAAGADVNTRTDHNTRSIHGSTPTPLHSAARNGTVEMVQLLIAAGAKVEDGTSVWDLAQKNEKLEGTETLWSLAEALGECSRWCDPGWWKQTTAADLQTQLDAGVYNKLSDEDRETAWSLAKSSPLKGSPAYWALNDARFK
jgi:ankyrin repeat protein